MEMLEIAICYIIDINALFYHNKKTVAVDIEKQ
jgi:hypothetical protein